MSFDGDLMVHSYVVLEVYIRGVQRSTKLKFKDIFQINQAYKSEI